MAVSLDNYPSNTYILAKTYTSALMKAHLWNITDGKAIAE